MPIRVGGTNPLVLCSGRAAAARLVIALAGTILGAPPALAQPAPPPAGGDLMVFTGRDFGGVDLPVSPRALPMTINAARGYSWREGATNRWLLERDVRIVIGPYRFTADAAVFWLEPVTVAGRAVDQVAIYLVNARDPSGPVDSGQGPASSDRLAGGWLSQAAPRLLVTAQAFSDSGSPPAISTDIPLHDERPSLPLVAEAEARLARHLAGLTAGAAGEAAASGAGQAGLVVSPEGEGGQGTIRTLDQAAPTATDPLPEGVGEPPRGLGGRDLTVDTRARSPLTPRTSPISPKEGVVEFYSPDNQLVDLEGGPEKNNGAARALIMSGGVSVQYDTIGRAQSVHLAAQRAVAFVAPRDAAAATRFSSKDILGVYLEGDVEATVRNRKPQGPTTAADQYTLRGSKVYYDIRKNSAVVLDAVFWTYDAERGMPLYLRASEIRQRSLKEFTARKATLANVSFAEPGFAIGLSEVTIARDTNAEGRTVNTFDARDVVFTAGGVPLAYVPKVAGEFKASPLRRIEFERNAGSSVTRTVWDMYTILGLNSPSGNRWDLLVDGYLDRGPAVGTDLRIVRNDLNINTLAYYVHDTGRDHLSSGADRDPPQENRGLITGDALWRLDEHWTLFAEGSYISDAPFIDSFFRRDAQTRREYASSLYLRRLEDNEAITAELRGTFNDFISNQYLLESLGYQREKLPEFQYFRVGEDLFGGLLSYTGEARYSSERLAFDKARLKEHGYNTISRADQGFGLLPGDSLATMLRARGLDELTVTKFDTRHDFEAPLTAGPFNIVPFAVGRFTAYDTDFGSFNAGEPQDRERYWGSAGVRAATSLTKTDSSVESEAFDIHGLRHIITPNLTAFSSGSNVDPTSLPNYDENIESIATGSTVRVGAVNTLQTHRPGTSPGTRGTLRSVDLLKLDTNYVWASGDSDVESPFGRFIEARPELSNLGQYFSNDAVLQLSDALAITSDVLYDSDNSSLARITGGVQIDHGFGFSTFAEYRALEAISARYFDMGAKYELTRKYALTLEGVYDLDRDEFQSIGGRLTRRFPQWTVELGFHVNTITDEFGVGFVFTPAGSSGAERRRVFTHEFDDLPVANDRRDPVRDRIDFGPFAD